MAQFIFPTIGSRAEGRATLLAIDDYSLPLKRNLCYYLSRPQVRPEPALVPDRDRLDRPDYLGAYFYGTVLYDEGRYRMWYYACHIPQPPDNTDEGPLCYAELGDGLHWVKPNLGQVSFRGNEQNNIIALPESRTEGVTLLKDEEEPDPTRRYKLAYNCWSTQIKTFTVRMATSPDGLHWTAGDELPIQAFVEQASFYKHGGLYFVNGQMSGRSEGGHPLGRQAFAVVSPDFEHWIQEKGESFLLPEPANPADRGGAKPYDQAHIGVGAASFGNVLVGLYCIWHNKPFPTPGDWFGKGTTSGDFGLVVSNDGLHFREPVKGRVFMHRDDTPVRPTPPFKHQMVLTQGNGILNVGDETRIYHGRWVNAANPEDYYSEVALATLPRDRWGALGLFPEQTEGTVWSAPVTLPVGGCRMTLNADAASGMRVEIADERSTLLPQYSGEQSGTVAVPSGLDCPVRWAQSLAALGGQTVRFRIRIQQESSTPPRLYAVALG